MIDILCKDSNRSCIIMIFFSENEKCVARMIVPSNRDNHTICQNNPNLTEFVFPYCAAPKNTDIQFVMSQYRLIFPGSFQGLWAQLPSLAQQWKPDRPPSGPLHHNTHSHPPPAGLGYIPVWSSGVGSGTREPCYGLWLCFLSSYWFWRSSMTPSTPPSSEEVVPPSSCISAAASFPSSFSSPRSTGEDTTS